MHDLDIVNHIKQQDEIIYWLQEIHSLLSKIWESK